MMYMWVYELII